MIISDSESRIDFEKATEIDFEAAKEGMSAVMANDWVKKGPDLWELSKVMSNTRFKLRAKIKRSGPRTNPRYYGVVKNVRTGNVVASTGKYPDRETVLRRLTSLRSEISKEMSG